MNTALVLSGGGSKGAFQAGALQELAVRDVEYQSVAGVSVGALNGIMVAADRLPQMMRLWQTITRSDVYKKRSIPLFALQYLVYKIGLSSPPKSIYSNQPLFELLKREFKDIKLHHSLTIGRVDLTSGDYVNEIHPDDHSRFTKEALASTAIPIIWEPVSIADDLFVDGGVRNMTPLKDVIKSNPDRIIVITTSPLSGPQSDPSIRDFIDIAKRSLTVLLDEIFQEDLRRCIQINHLVKQADEQGMVLKSKKGEPIKYYELVIIQPPEHLGNALNFERDRLDRLIKMGQQAVETAFN